MLVRCGAELDVREDDGEEECKDNNMKIKGGGGLDVDSQTVQALQRKEIRESWMLKLERDCLYF